MNGAPVNFICMFSGDIMNYREARSCINSISGRGISMGTERIRLLLERLGNPQKQLKAVHAAGTNGKGSTLALSESVLRHAGFKTGIYLSPAVCEYRETICCGGGMITEEEFADAFSCVWKAADGLSDRPTVFEMETATAFLHFCRKGCEIVFIEAGMGGRDDATNVFDGALCNVITRIGLDHTRFLGGTAGEIAENKAEIIKQNGSVVLGIQDERFSDEVFAAVKKKADETGSEIIFARDFLETASGYKTGLAGQFQRMNAAAALGVIDVLKKKGYPAGDEDIRSGFAAASLPARFETIHLNPRIIIDGAHNAGAAEQLAAEVMKHFTNEPIVFIMGVFSDKEYEKIAQITVPLADAVITLTPKSERALDAEKLVECVKRYTCNAGTASGVCDALDKACSMLKFLRAKAKGDGVIIAFGSFSFLGELKRAAKDL